MGRLMIIFIIVYKNVKNMPFPLLGRGLALPSLGLFGPSFSWVGVGLPSRVEGWPFSGLKLGLVPPPWGWGWLFLFGTMIIISEVEVNKTGIGPWGRGSPFSEWGLALPSLGSGLALRVGVERKK